jgi:hypothetical protein
MDFTKELTLIVDSEKPTFIWQFATGSAAEASALAIFAYGQNTR